MTVWRTLTSDEIVALCALDPLATREQVREMRGYFKAQGLDWRFIWEVHEELAALHGRKKRIPVAVVAPE